MADDLLIRPEAPGDSAAVRAVVRSAFGRDDEADLVEALRDGGFFRLALVAERAGSVVGHVLFGELTIRTAAGPVAALALAPLAVLPEAQRSGVGTALVREGLAACRAAGHRFAVVLGDPAYYGRFGFTAEAARPLESPFPRPAFQALELTPGALAGVAGRVVYPPPFGVE